MITQQDQIDIELQKNGYSELDLTKKDLDVLSSGFGEKIQQQVITLTSGQNLRMAAEPAPGGAYDPLNKDIKFIGNSVSFKYHYINSYISNDLEININLPASGAPNAARFSFQRFDNDLQIWAIQIYSRNNKQILNYNQQDGLILSPLFSTVYEKLNLNLQGHFIEQQIYPLGSNDLRSATNGANAATAITQSYKQRFKLSDVFGGKNSYFKKYMFISDDELEYKITFTPSNFRILEGADSSNVAWVPVSHAALPVNTNVEIKQQQFILPSQLRSELLQKNYYLKFDYVQRIQLQDIILNPVNNPDQQIQFNIVINKSNFGYKLNAIGICHMNSVNPLCTTDGNYGTDSVGISYRKIVPNNNMFYNQLIQVQQGQDMIIDLNSVGEVQGYFMQNLQYMNIPQDLGKCMLFLGPEKVMQYSNQDQIIFSVNLKLANGQAAEKLWRERDIFVYVMGQNSVCVKNGKIQQSQIMF